MAPTALYKEYLSEDYVHRMVKRHDTGEGDFGLPLWALLSFEVWLRALPGWLRQAQTIQTDVRPS
jgi:hypothetical protein